MRKFLATFFSVAILITSIFGVTGVNVVQAVDLASATWTPITAGNNQNDYVYDQQTGSTPVSQDIVGDASNSATYISFADE